MEIFATLLFTFLLMWYIIYDTTEMNLDLNYKPFQTRYPVRDVLMDSFNYLTVSGILVMFYFIVNSLKF